MAQEKKLIKRRICIHGREHYRCTHCSPIKCQACNKIYSKGTFKRHIKTNMHIKNCENLNYNIEPSKRYVDDGPCPECHGDTNGVYLCDDAYVECSTCGNKP